MSHASSVHLKPQTSYRSVILDFITLYKCWFDGVRRLTQKPLRHIWFPLTHGLLKLMHILFD